MSKKWKLEKKPDDVCWSVWDDVYKGKVASTTITNDEIVKAVMVEKGLIETENYDKTKPEPFPYTIITNPKLAEFISNNIWWGWYLSAEGTYCYSFGRYVLAIFINSDTGELEVTVDDVITDSNVAWETIENIKNPYEIIRGLMRRYCLE